MYFGAVIKVAMTYEVRYKIAILPNLSFLILLFIGIGSVMISISDGFWVIAFEKFLKYFCFYGSWLWSGFGLSSSMRFNGGRSY
jgi:hypothetical protein